MISEQATRQALAVYNVRFGDETVVRPGPMLPADGCVLPARGDRQFLTLSSPNAHGVLAVNVAQLCNGLPALASNVFEFALELNRTENSANPLLDELFLPGTEMRDDLFAEILQFLSGPAVQFDLTDFNNAMQGIGVQDCSPRVWYLFNLICRVAVSPGRSIPYRLFQFFQVFMDDITGTYYQQGITAWELWNLFTLKASLGGRECALAFLASAY